VVHSKASPAPLCRCDGVRLGTIASSPAPCWRAPMRRMTKSAPVLAGRGYLAVALAATFPFLSGRRTVRASPAFVAARSRCGAALSRRLAGGGAPRARGIVDGDCYRPGTVVRRSVQGTPDVSSPPTCTPSARAISRPRARPLSAERIGNRSAGSDGSDGVPERRLGKAARQALRPRHPSRARPGAERRRAGDLERDLRWLCGRPAPRRSGPRPHAGDEANPATPTSGSGERRQAA
jgi:hypothetical protein